LRSGARVSAPQAGALDDVQFFMERFLRVSFLRRPGVLSFSYDGTLGAMLLQNGAEI
jgi:hypothetical protein